jgi:5-methylthioadenosine/S-adenosylhomocysteine deaminase
MKTLIQNVTVVTVDPELGNFPSANILIEDGKISALGVDVSTPADEIMDASELIAMPGFVNGHLHLWQPALRGIAGDWTLGHYFHVMIGDVVCLYKPDDVYIGNFIGALDQINSGVTTLVDWCHIVNTPEHADAAVDALLESGIRAVFSYGTPMSLFGTLEPHPADARRMRTERLNNDDARVTMALAIRGPDFAPGTAAKDIRYARELDLHATFHIACGKLGPREEGVLMLEKAGLLGEDINLVHANFLSDREFQVAADNGVSIAITPEVEMQMALGLPPTGQAVKAGAIITIGTDIVTDVSTDMFSQMRFTLQTARALRNDAIHKNESMPDELDMTAKDVLEFATIDGARAFGLENKTGSLTPGKDADITFLRKTDINLVAVRDPVMAIVLHANPANVDTVMIQGEIVKHKGKLVHADLDKKIEDLKNSSDRLYEQMQSSDA